MAQKQFNPPSQTSDDHSFLIIGNSVRQTALETKRVKGLQDAIQRAGGHTKFASGNYTYSYSRDFFAVIHGVAFYPIDRRFPDGLSDEQKMMAINLEAYGYRLYPIDVDTDFQHDGGNILYDSVQKKIFCGLYSVFGESSDIDVSIFPFGKQIGSLTNNEVHFITSTAKHLDTVMGILPDGRILVKLNEIDYGYEFREASGLGDDIDVTEFLEGVISSGVYSLQKIYGKENVITFAFTDNLGADFVIDAKTIQGNVIKARSLAMLTNFESIGQTIVAEDFPLEIGNRIRANGVHIITPQNVGTETFIRTDEPNAGGARCCTIKVRPISQNSFSYSAELRNILRL